MLSVVLAVVVAAVFCLGCGDELSPEARAAEVVRELELIDDVPVRKVSREQFAAEAAERAAGTSDEYLAYYADTYGRLGFFDRSLDLRPIFAGSSSDWVGATYSPSAQLITLVGDALRPDITVHEWVHAIQDQHFDISSFDVHDSSDSFLARRAIVEGDATLAQYRYIAVYDHDVELDGLDWAAALDTNRERALRTLVEAEYPPVFLDYVSFVYTYGLEYAVHNLTGVTVAAPVMQAAPHDWGRANQLFASDAPVTTQAILGLGRVAAADDPVLAVGLETLPTALGERFEVLDWDSLGQWYSYLLLFPLDAALEPPATAASLAGAWDGDRALFIRDLTDGAVATVWASVWEDEQAAQTVADAMWQLYGKLPIEGQPDHIAVGDDGESVWVERRGKVVVAARNLALDVASEVIEASFLGPFAAAPRQRPSLAAALRQRRAGGRLNCPIVR